MSTLNPADSYVQISEVRESFPDGFSTTWENAFRIDKICVRPDPEGPNTGNEYICTDTQDEYTFWVELDN